MLVESSRVLGFLPQFSRILRINTIGISKFCTSALNTAEKIEEPSEIVQSEQSSEKVGFENFSFKFPEFLPRTNPKYRNALLEKLERRDMLRRRNVIHIPEFYVGSILAVTTSDKHSPGKVTRFVGICIWKLNAGLKSKFLLRNVIDHQGIEIMYTLYNPVIQKIEVLRLEKRLDNPLFYLRDAPHEYSTFPMDMIQEYHDDKKPVPVNTIKVPLNPRPWLRRYERMYLKGVILPPISEKLQKLAEKRATPWKKYDIMDKYRKLIPEEEQKDIFDEISEELKVLESKYKHEKKKKVFVTPTKQKVF